MGISTGSDMKRRFNKTMEDSISDALSKEARGEDYFKVKNVLDSALDEEEIDVEEATGASSSGSYSGPLFGKMESEGKGKVNKIDKIKNSDLEYSIKESLRKHLVETEEEEELESEEEELGEETGASSSGAYSQPAIWAKNNKNWRAVSDKNFPKYGGPGATYVKVKDKCKKFPYCNQGDINALQFYEEDKLVESIERVSKKLGKSKSYVAKVIMEAMEDSNLGKKLRDTAEERARNSEKKNKKIRVTKEELEEMITRSFYKSPVTDPKAGIVGVAKMDLPIGKMFSMSGNKPKYE